MRDQFQLLFGLYTKPVHAASRIIDEGWLWFAVVLALLALVGLQMGLIVPFGKAALPSGMQAPQPHPPTPADDDRDEPAPSPRMGQVFMGLLAWTLVSSPFLAVKLLGILALAFVPAAVLVITMYRSHESFPIMLRKDYLPLLNCLLLSLAAAFLPVAIMAAAGAPIRLWIAGAGLGFLYFLFLAACCVRTLWGLSYGVASLATGVGCAAMLGGGAVAVLSGGGFYYLSSPFFLYYAWLFVGSDVRSLGDGFRSRQHLRRQLDIAANNPRDSDAHYQLGLIYQQRRQFEEARKRFTRAFEIDPHEAEPAFQLGRIALEEGKLEEAVDWFRKAAALDDKCAANEVWRDLGVAHLKAERLDEAQAALDKYVGRRPYDPEGLYWQGKSLLALRKLDEAVRAFESCQEAVTTMPPHRRRQLGRWKRMAVDEAKKAEKLKP